MDSLDLFFYFLVFDNFSKYSESNKNLILNYYKIFYKEYL